MLFELAYFRTRPFRKVNEERDSTYPAFRRNDIYKWARYKFYPGALLLMPTRIFLFFIFAAIAAFLTIILGLGTEKKIERTKIYINDVEKGNPEKSKLTCKKKTL